MTQFACIIDPGPFTTVQDLGRYGFQRYGIPVSGCLDEFSYRAANLLVGNREDAAVLELTFAGLRFKALSDGFIALTGADMPILVNREKQPQWQRIAVRTGDEVAIRPARSGVRAYLAISGGIAVPAVMGSRSTLPPARLGGHCGRTLASGDVLSVENPPWVETADRLPEALRPRREFPLHLRAVPGPQDDFFDKGMDLFFSSTFTVSTQADRMGYRLDGPVIPFKEGAAQSIISEPSLPGAVQVVPSGQAIILFVEQTVGGYAKIATVLSCDLNALSQCRPGDAIRFARITIDEAHRALAQYRSHLDAIRDALRATDELRVD